MADLPYARVSIEEQASAYSEGTDLIALFACVERNANASSPMLFSSSKDAYAEKGYTPGVAYISRHVRRTNKPVLLFPLPIVTAGALGSYDSSAVEGTSTISVAAGSAGCLETIDGIVDVVVGGVVGTPGAELDVSIDGGRTATRVRLGAATSYAIPYVGVTVSFGAGTLVAGDRFRFLGSAPKPNAAGISAARAALAAQQKQVRTILVDSDVDASTAATVLAETNALETENDRYVLARVSVLDRRVARMSRQKKVMKGAPELTFAEVGASGDTVTRATGSWIDDGFAIGDVVTFTGTTSNNVSGPITALTATVMTFGTSPDLVAEVTSAAKCVGSTPLTFAEVGATGDTITRTSGSWIVDGFAVGDTVTITGTASNNISAVISALTATVMTFDTEDLAAEVIGQHSVTIERVESLESYIAKADLAYAGIDGQRRIDISIGRGSDACPFLGAWVRRPASWAASIEEYALPDIHLATYEKARGPLTGWDLTDVDGKTVEIDARTNKSALAARFTCLRSYGNGPLGTFIALSLTREQESKVLSRSHNMHVANRGCAVVQAETEAFIGRIEEKDAAGRLTQAARARLEAKVNGALDRALRQRKAGVPTAPASFAKWSADPNAILTPGSVLGGVLDLRVGATLERIATVTRVS